MSREVCEHWNEVNNCEECLDIEDIMLWPCDTWCFRYELSQFSFMSDDYRIIKYGTEEHERITLL